MNRNRRKFVSEYQQNKSDIQSRQKQTIHSGGNYRIDREGNPIIPRPTYVDEKYDQEGQNQDRDRRKQHKNVYNFQDYQSRENDLIDRMRQPNNRSYQNNSHYSATVPSNSYQNSRRKDSWYSKILHWVNYQTRNKSWTEGLPAGRITLFGVFSLIYLIMLVSGWQLMPMNKVNNLRVTGNELVPSEFVINSSRIYHYDDIDTVTSQKKAIESLIKEENPLIESISFNRPDWRVFELAVSEHDIVAVINIDEAAHVLLSNGDVLNIGSNRALTGIARDNLPIVEGFNDSYQLENLAKGLRQIDSSILAMMDRIVYSNNPNKSNAIEVNMKDGNLIKAIISTFSQKVQHYPELLSQLDGKTGIVNFEVGAYFTPTSENANSVKLDNN